MEITKKKGALILPSDSNLFGSRYRIWLVMFGVALFFGIASNVPSFIYSFGNDRTINWIINLPQRLPSYLVWLIFIPLLHTKARMMFGTNSEFLNKAIRLTGWIVFVAFLHRLVTFLIVSVIIGNLGSTLGLLFSSPGEVVLPLISLAADSLSLAVILTLTALTIEYTLFVKAEGVKQEELRRHLLEARLQNLSGSLHPHFLFNALQGVSIMIHKDPFVADKMLSSLSELLRSTFSNSENQFIPLKQEIETGRNYLSIQKMRFGNRIRESMNLPGMGGEVKVPRFILLPLLENCIKHNVDLSPNPVEIDLNVAVTESNISIGVSNSRPQEYHKTAIESGEGLKQIRSRLEILYEGNFKFEIMDAERSFMVNIILPVRNDV